MMGARVPHAFCRWELVSHTLSVWLHRRTQPHRHGPNLTTVHVWLASPPNPASPPFMSVWPHRRSWLAGLTAKREIDKPPPNQASPPLTQPHRHGLASPPRHSPHRCGEPCVDCCKPLNNKSALTLCTFDGWSKTFDHSVPKHVETYCPHHLKHVVRNIVLSTYEKCTRSMKIC